jgi:hypothetical protein
MSDTPHRSLVLLVSSYKFWVSHYLKRDPDSVGARLAREAEDAEYQVKPGR